VGAIKKGTSKHKKAGARKRCRALTLCKPCWELKYCPYGIIVETMPLLPERTDGGSTRLDEKKQEQLYERAKKALSETDFKNDDRIWENIFSVLFTDPYKWKAVEGYSPQDISCRFFGHVCPVFFYGYEDVTETKDLRRRGRHIPREIMLKVVRRDDYRCQLCRKTVDDRDIEFDHIIPHSKGGPTNVENVRLLCSECNRKKSNSLVELLDDFNPPAEILAEMERERAAAEAAKGAGPAPSKGKQRR
jgi:hypothetical protein